MAEEILDPWCLAASPKMITFEDITAAAFKIKSGVIRTRCERSHMCEMLGMDLWLKQDFMQYTGSFKERGARYALLSLCEEKRLAGVVAASAGNHAQGLAYHGRQLGVPVTVVMPTSAPLMKIQKCRNYGANVIVQGNTLAEAKSVAMRLGQENSTTYINGYDHPYIIAGAGSMGLEICEQVADFDAIIIPIGGGGLISGVGLAIKSLYPKKIVIGVQSERCQSFQKALDNGKPTFTGVEPTLADGLAVPLVGYNSFAIASTVVDRVVPVKEDHIALAILRLAELEKFVIEGAGAIGVGAILSGQLNDLKGKKVVAILSGGNIDTTVMSRCLDRGLAVDHRLVKFIVTVGDKPGGIADICRLLASIGVSIKDVSYERTFTKADVFHVDLKFICETRDEPHATQLITMLTETFGSVVLPGYSCRRHST